MTRRLIIAEKPNVAKAIAAALGNGHQQKDAGGWRVGNDLIVACSGHILENFDPEDYDQRYGKWRLEDLPVAPQVWRLKPIKGKEQAVERIRLGMQNSDVVVHGGDIDAEGQVLVDEVIEYLGWQGPVQRVLIADLNPEPIRKAFAQIRDNKEPSFVGLSLKALSRSHGDWLLGLNCSRLYTLLGNEAGIRGSLSAGRVQSAMLGLVARRDIEIEQFKPHDYLVAKARFSHASGTFDATWKPREGQQGLDEEGRLISPDVARRLLSMAPGPAQITSAQTQRKKEPAPLPFSLSDLQKTANRKLGLSMLEVLNIAQRLYDQHQLITYPRADTGYLPEGHHEEGPAVLGAIASNLPDVVSLASQADPAIRSRAFNDKKVNAHHGIIPTGRKPQSGLQQLTSLEAAVYQLIAQRYMVQFFPSAEFDATTIEVSVPPVNGECFIAHGKVWIKQGYRVVFQNGAEEALEDELAAEDVLQSLPAVVSGESVHADKIGFLKKQTKPPKPYTDATLLTAMTGIHRYVTNPDTRKLLREGDGIGTEATRAGIVEALVKRLLLARVKKDIVTTANGRMLYHLLPPDLTTPDMAGLFEASTKAVESGRLTIEAFRKNVLSFVSAQISGQEEWLQKARSIVPQPKVSEYNCRGCQRPLYTQLSAKKIAYFVCTGEDCGCMFRDVDGVPGMCFKGPLKDSDAAEMEAEKQQRLAAAPPCPECGNPALRYQKKGTDFHYWRCENTAEKTSCESVFKDNFGRPGDVMVLRGESKRPAPDGPACPVCKKPTRKGVTREKQKPILTCSHCDSMCWVSDDGSPGDVFKKKGKLVKKKRTAKKRTT